MSGRYVLAVSLDPLDATTVLFFGHLAERMAGALRVVRYGQPDLAGHVAGASAVILVRALFEMTPVVWAARPPYDHLGDEGVVLQCDDTVESWHSALALACQPATRRRIGERLTAFCAANFSGTVNWQVIDEMIGARPAPAAVVALWRRAGVRCAFLVDQIRRATRWVR